MTPLDLLAQSAADNFALCQNALSQQERYWLGCGWLRALVSRRAGQSSPTSIKAATAQLSTFVSEHELVNTLLGNAITKMPMLIPAPFVA